MSATKEKGNRKTRGGIFITPPTRAPNPKGTIPVKGIVLAGGTGTRLHPITRITSKHLLPVYDKPMVFYPLSTLMLCGVREILIISTPRDLPQYRALLGDGTEWGLKLTYAEQEKPAGIAQALLIGKQHIGRDSVALILGDNIFFGQGLSQLLANAAQSHTGATIFGYFVKDPRRYGVASFDAKGNVIDIEEKPKEPRSNYAIVGLYMYDADAPTIASRLEPSRRGELEITDLNRAYLQKKKLRLVQLGRGSAWFDAGTHEALLDTANFIATIEKRQGLKIACLEEVAYRMGYIDEKQLKRLADDMKNPDYQDYLRGVLRDGKVEGSPHPR